MDANVLCMCIVSCICWGAFGFLEKDAFIAAPNIFGLFFVAIQFVIYLWAGNHLPDIFCCLCAKAFRNKEDKEKSEENSPLVKV